MFYIFSMLARINYEIKPDIMLSYWIMFVWKVDTTPSFAFHNTESIEPHLLKPRQSFYTKHQLVSDFYNNIDLRCYTAPFRTDVLERYLSLRSDPSAFTFTLIRRADRIQILTEIQLINQCQNLINLSRVSNPSKPVSI